MMNFKLVLLSTDALIFLLVATIVVFIFYARKKVHWRSAWQQVLRNKFAMVSLVVLFAYVGVALLDSIHYQPALQTQHKNGVVHYSPRIKSLLDKLISPLGVQHEKTYSAPFALQSFSKESSEDPSGKIIRIYPRLQYAGKSITTQQEKVRDIVTRIAVGFAYALLIAALLLLVVTLHVKNKHQHLFKETLQNIFHNNYQVPWRLLFVTTLCLLISICCLVKLAGNYHVFGTDKIGQDVLFETIKSIRTGLVIGTLATLVMLPFAIILGIAAGYYGGLLDDVIQYIYTTLSSIPGVLLIAAAVLSLQVFISNHPNIFPTLAQRADARLLALCLILGVTSWTGLCRMLRAETLKLREVDYIQAAKALGSRRLVIIGKHILPNVLHIVLIAVVLDFSTLVLAEAVLSYVGVGVSPTTISWGNMINSARLELAREPIVWWPILAAFIFMFILVLCANLFSDGVRDAFDPRLRKQGSD